MSVVIMDDPVMLMAAKKRPHYGRSPSPALPISAPTSWADLWSPAAAGKVIIPSLKNTEGYWALLAAAHLETGKAVQGSAIRDRRGLQEIGDAEVPISSTSTQTRRRR